MEIDFYEEVYKVVKRKRGDLSFKHCGVSSKGSKIKLWLDTGEKFETGKTSKLGRSVIEQYGDRLGVKKQKLLNDREEEALRRHYKNCPCVDCVKLRKRELK